MKNEELFSLNNEDLWQFLATDHRPIVVYGMGNGADKLLARLARIGREPAAFFASDDFVRGQSFHGFRVFRFSEIKERFSDFIILVSFGSRQPDVMDNLFAMAEEHTLFLPDMPVAGEEDFTASFASVNKHNIQAAFDLLSDDLSRRIFKSVLQYKLTGDIRFLKDAHSTEEQDYGCLSDRRISIAVDAGAYTGDTAQQMMKHFSSLEKIYAIEPDAKTFKKLQKFAADNNSATRILPINAALWSSEGDGLFAASGNRNSSLLSSSYEHKDISVPLVTIDALMKEERVDYIKYDVEGAEKEALLGSVQTIQKDCPALAVSLYHRSEDIFDLPLFIHKICKNRQFFLRRVHCLPAREITLYVV